MDPLYRWCASLLAGEDGTLPAPPPGVEAGPLLAAIERQGIVALAHARVAGAAAGREALPDGFTLALAERARDGAARQLLCMDQARRIQRALDDAGIATLWLKGAALARWLYPQPHLREFADLDLLFADRADALRAAAVLEPLGYVLPNPHVAGDLVVHELLAWHAPLRLELDLHWDLNNYPLLAGRIRWPQLQAGSIAVAGLGSGARALGQVHALAHACIHHAANRLGDRQERLRWLYDIHLLASRLDRAGWDALLADARAGELGAVVLDALQASNRLFGTALDAAVLHALQAQAAREWLCIPRLHSWAYWQYATWRVLPDARTRLRWLRQLLLPDMAHLRVRYGADGAGPLRLLWRRLHDGGRRLRRYARR